MEKVIDLKDLLKHEIIDLYSAEEQIIEALPMMIEKAGNDKLKAALQEHLRITEEQKNRLDEVKQLMAEAEAENENGQDNNEDENGDGSNQKKGGFLSRLFGTEGEKCKGMEGLISEGQKMMSSDMSAEAADAAIIASAQKIEHYEISGYGTARAYARELKLDDVAGKLEQTLMEEYTSDDILTELAVGKVNVDAEFASQSQNGINTDKQSGAGFKKGSNNKSNGRSGGNQNKAVAKKGNSGANSKTSPVKSNASKSPAKAPSKSPVKSSSKSPAKSSKPPVKSPAKSTPAKKNPAATKKSSSGGRNGKATPKKMQAPVKSQAAAKRTPAKFSKGGSNKSASKGRSSRRR